MGYTRRKIRGINFSFLLAGLIFAGWALVCAWFGWPRGFRHGSATAFALFGLTAIFFCAFPAIWTRYPGKHPVIHELARYGKPSEISRRLDSEMAGHVDRLGPFRFTAAILVYDSGHEFQMVPYDQIVSAETDPNEDTAKITVVTRSGRRYQWFSTWMQGYFNPEEVRGRICTAAHLDEPNPPAPND